MNPSLTKRLEESLDKKDHPSHEEEEYHPRVSRRDVLISDAKFLRVLRNIKRKERQRRQHEVVVLSTSESTTGSDYNSNVLPDDILRLIVSYSSPRERAKMALVNKQFHRITSSYSNNSLQDCIQRYLLDKTDYKDEDGILSFNYTMDLLANFSLAGRLCITLGEIQWLMVVLFLHTTHYPNLPLSFFAFWSEFNFDLLQFPMMSPNFTQDWTRLWTCEKNRPPTKSQRKLKVSMYSTAKDFTSQLLSIKSETKRCDFAFDNGYKIFAYWLHEEFGYEWKNSSKAAAAAMERGEVS